MQTRSSVARERGNNICAYLAEEMEGPLGKEGDEDNDGVDKPRVQSVDAYPSNTKIKTGVATIPDKFYLLSIKIIHEKLGPRYRLSHQRRHKEINQAHS